VFTPVTSLAAPINFIIILNQNRLSNKDSEKLRRKDAKAQWHKGITAKDIKTTNTQPATRN